MSIISPLESYDRLLGKFYEDIRENRLGKRDNRTGISTYMRFAEQIRVPVSEKKFPWPTKRKLKFSAMAGELLTFLQGKTETKDFRENGCNFWDPWGQREYLDKVGLKMYPEGELGPIYGQQWVAWNGSTNQIVELVDGLKNNPNGRRHIVTAWNPTEVSACALPPCHMFFQCVFESADNSVLSMHMYMRSADLFVGVPFNIGSYALLLCLIAKELGVEPGNLVITMGDCHVYENHVPFIAEYLSRHALVAPSLCENYPSLFGWKTTGQIYLTGYEAHPTMSVPVAI